MLAALARFYSDGGIFMHLVLLLGLASVAGVVIQFCFLRRRLDPLPITIGLVVALLGAGLLGTIAGMSQAMEVIAMVSPEMRGQLTAQASAVAAHPLTFALVFGVVLVPPATLAAALRAAVRTD